MFSRIFSISLMIIFICLSLGCFSAPVIPPFAGTFTQYSAPIDTEYGSSIGIKVGQAQSTSIIGLFAWGDASIYTAARNGQLNRVDYVGYNMLNVLGIYQGWTTVVYGE